MTAPGPVLDRAREVELLTAALDGGAHVLLEGPPGTGKSTLLRAVSTARSAPFHLVEGNAELTPARLVGHFDPAQVLAMRAGGLLYVEEINRVPEETLNVLITVMSEAELTVPRLGLVHAEEGFRLVAAMNPFDAVGTERISSAIYDRTCRIAMDYQSAETEADIVALRGPSDAAWRARVVDLVRRTRGHGDVRIGSSVRGAIDLVAIATRLAEMRGVPPDDWQAGLDAALVSLSGRIRMHESAGRRPEDVVRELYEQVFGAPPSFEEAGEGADSGEA